MPNLTPVPPPHRSGLIAGGNFIVDNIVRIDRFPEQDTLANIQDEVPSNGGGPFNILRDLAALQSPFSLSAIGLVGRDAHGDWVERICRQDDIETTQLHRHESAATSHTHVMTVDETGRRTFFHHRGANAALSPSHFDFQHSSAKIFYLGYLLLLDGLDTPDNTGRTGASYVLENAKLAGLETVVDLVSVTDPNFRTIVSPSLEFIDHLILNEVEATQFLGTAISATDFNSLRSAATQLLQQGVRRSVVIHTAAGAVITSHTEAIESLGSLEIPSSIFRGANGAGDAFAAGYIFGLHENWSPHKRLQLAISTAACSLTEASPSAGVPPLSQSLAMADKYPTRAWGESQGNPVQVS